MPASRRLIALLLLCCTPFAQAAIVSNQNVSPNPFNNSSTSTTISYDLANNALLWLRIYDSGGTLKRKLVDPTGFTTTNRSLGTKSETWNGRDDASALVAPGNYDWRIDDVRYVTQSTSVGQLIDDVAVDPTNSNVLWATSKGNARLFKSTNGGSSWSAVTYSGGGPRGIAITSNGQTLWVADETDARVYRSTNGGSSWSNVTWSSPLKPRDIAVTADGAVAYGVDQDTSKVYKWNGSSWSQTGAQPTGINSPRGVAVHPTNSNLVYVADDGANKVWVSTNGGASWTQFASQGTSSSTYNDPYDVEVDANGYVWISDKTYNRIQQYRSDGTHLMTIGGTSSGTGNYQFHANTSALGLYPVTFSGSTYVYIADYNNQRVKRYEYGNWTSTTAIEVDTMAPAAVSNLAAGSATVNSLQLTWTAPGDDNSTGRATSYDIRYSTSTIDGTNWASATQINDEPTPSTAGTSQSYTVTGLSSNTTYYFAIKTSDSVPHESGLSNVASGTTLVGDSTAPAAINDLNTGAITEGSVALSWTATGDDGGTGTATSYDVRYRTGGPVTSSNWSTSTQATGEPAPAAAGATENFTVSGLVSGTTYYFAVRAGDETPNWSPISNSPGTTTTADVTAPAAVSNLAATGPTNTTVTLTWTAPGDNNASGTATTYDIRYSTAAINAGNWDSATQASGEPSPQAAGGSESYTVTGLNANTTYYFAIKTADEATNWSGLSNVPSTSTTNVDETAPAQITNLAVTGSTSTSVSLSWTATGDDGSTGTATSYDVRYSTSAITSGNWGAATQATGEPAPLTAGTAQTFTVTGLSASTTYYFAIRAVDDNGNSSSLSNTPTGTTEPSSSTLVRYPSGKVSSGSPADNAFYSSNAATDMDSSDGQHGELQGNGKYIVVDMDDTSASGTITQVVLRGLAYDNSSRNDDQIRFGLRIGGTAYWGNSVSNVANGSATKTLYTGGTWTTNPATGAAWAWSDIDSLISMVHNQAGSSDIRVDQLYLEISHTADTTAPGKVDNLNTSGVTGSSVTLRWTAPGDDHYRDTAASYDIRYSTSTITNDNWASATTVTGEPTPGAAGISESMVIAGLSTSTTYYFALKTTDESSNVSVLSNIASATTLGAFSSNTIYPSGTASGDNATYSGNASSDMDTNDGQQGELSDATKHIAVQMDNPSLSGEIRRITVYALAYDNSSRSDDSFKFGIRVGGTDYWSQTFLNLPTSDTLYTGPSWVVNPDTGAEWSWTDINNLIAVVDNVSGTATIRVDQLYIQIEYATDSTAPAPVSNLGVISTGSTSATLTWTAPGDDNNVGRATSYDVRYSTSAIDAGNWGSATQVTGEPTPAMAGSTETYTVTGLSASTTYYFALKATDNASNVSGLSNVPSATTQAGDVTAPAAITNLATTGTPSNTSITLTWTAPGDDNSTGTARTYDVRYATSTINDSNWASATQASGEPAPQAAGSTEVFTVTGLAFNTQYYFAVKTSDEVPNTASLSNVTNNTTANTGGTTLTLHPSDSAGGDEATYFSNAATDLDTHDSDTTRGNLTASNSVEMRLELDDPGVSFGNIISVQIKAVLRDNGGSSTDQMRIGLKTQSTEYWGSVISNVSTSYTTYSGSAYSANPNTGAPWTWSDITNLIGLVGNYNGATDYRITELYAEVKYEYGDTIAPASVSNLSASGPSTTAVTLNWTAPGDDGNVGTSSIYDLRYATASITEENWASATPVSGEPAPRIAGSLESMTVTGLNPGTTYYFSMKTRDEVPNRSGLSNVASVTTHDPPVGGHTADNIIPAAQIVQAGNGTGVLTITWKARDNQSNNVTLQSFQYSVDGGATWAAPGNDDNSAALSSEWNDNSGAGWSTAASFASASSHSFTLNTRHGTLTGLSGVDQSDVRVRFKLNDGTADSANHVTSDNFRVDNAVPTATVTSAHYDPSTGALVLTGTNFPTVANAGAGMKNYLDWSRLTWDINGDNTTTANVTFSLSDISSAVVTNDTTFTITLTTVKSNALQSTAGYGASGGSDTLDITAGFFKDAYGNTATTDGASDAPVAIARPEISVTKLTAVLSDPVNNGTNPLRIPGAVIEYSITPSNTGDASPDTDSTIITDVIDALRVAVDVTTGVTYTDGDNGAGLNVGAVTYSSTAAPGPYVYDYTPVPDADGYDGNVTSIKIPTTGTFAHGGNPAPSFTVRYRVKIK